MFIRTFTWGQANLSWSTVMEQTLLAAEKQGHFVSFISTNGYDGMQHWTEALSRDRAAQAKAFLKGAPFDLDITYTAPENLPSRFLASSKIKACRFDYESSICPPKWRGFWRFADFFLPSSHYVAKMFLAAGCPQEKIVVVPCGVDANIFKPDGEKFLIPSEKKFKFLCIGEPHYRKQIDKLLALYCKTFSAADDVTLVLKTKIFDDATIKERQIFEQDLRPVLSDLKKLHGSSMPEITLLTERIPNIADLYRAADAFVLMTASEGFGLPFLEAVACGLPVIAPRWGGQLDFLNDGNSILTGCGQRPALHQEQYWHERPVARAVVGAPDEVAYAEAMAALVKNAEAVRNKLLPGMLSTAQQFTWESAAQKLTLDPLLAGQSGSTAPSAP